MESARYMVAGQEFELRHYGVKGMKWGVRKKPDLKAEKRRIKAEKKQARENRHSEYAAKRILGEEARYADRKAKRTMNKLGRLSKKLDKYYPEIDKAHDKGNFTKRDRYLDKYFDTFDKSVDYTAKFDSYVEKRDYAKRKLSEIESGTLQAGKDYIAHYREYYDGVYYVKDASLEFLTDKGRS